MLPNLAYNLEGKKASIFASILKKVPFQSSACSVNKSSRLQQEKLQLEKVSSLDTALEQRIHAEAILAAETTRVSSSNFSCVATRITIREVVQHQIR